MSREQPATIIEQLIGDHRPARRAPRVRRRLQPEWDAEARGAVGEAPEQYFQAPAPGVALRPVCSICQQTAPPADAVTTGFGGGSMWWFVLCRQCAESAGCLAASPP